MNKNISHNFQQLQTTWNNFGNSQPFWSVITHNVYKPENINTHIKEEFYKTGKPIVEMFEEILQKNNYTLKDKIVLDFGCGVGRITNSLHDIASIVYGMDISESHINLAKLVDTKTKFLLLNDPETLPVMEHRPNVIMSFITLQHSRPSLIKHHVDLLLNLLENEGIAVLHIPYDIPNYREEPNRVNIMEMHRLEKSEVLQISLSNRCQIIDVIEKDFCGGGIKNCIYVIKKLP